jgi:hypothetical protein
MVLSDEQIEEYRGVHREVFGTDISRVEAYDQATKLIRFLRVILQPMTEEELAAVKVHLKRLIKEEEK